MPQITRADIENIRNLSDSRLENALNFLHTTWVKYINLVDVRDDAQRNLNNVKKTIEHEAAKRSSSTGRMARAFCIVFSIALELFLAYYRNNNVTYDKGFIYTNIIHGFDLSDVLFQIFMVILLWILYKIGIYYFIGGALVIACTTTKPPVSVGLFYSLVPILLSYAIFIAPRSNFFKTDEEREAFLAEATEQHRAELQAAQEALRQAENARRAFFNSPEMSLVNYFRDGVGNNLTRSDLCDLLNIVREGYARTFPEARQVLAQQQHNREMQDIARERAAQEREHQAQMERAARESLNEQRRNNNEQRRAAENIAREAQRAADAEAERTRIAREMQRDFRGY